MSPKTTLRYEKVEATEPFHMSVNFRPNDVAARTKVKYLYVPKPARIHVVYQNKAGLRVTKFIMIGASLGLNEDDLAKFLCESLSMKEDVDTGHEKERPDNDDLGD